MDFEWQCCVNAVKVLVAQSCPTLCNLMPGSLVYGILQARILVWVAMPSSRESSQPRDWTRVSYISWVGRQVLYHYHHLDCKKRQSLFLKWKPERKTSYLSQGLRRMMRNFGERKQMGGKTASCFLQPQVVLYCPGWEDEGGKTGKQGAGEEEWETGQKERAETTKGVAGSILRPFRIRE